MGTEALAAVAPLSSDTLTVQEQIELGRDVLFQEARAVWRLANRLDHSFHQAVDLLHGCAGHVVVSGMGKAGLVGQKIAATLASTGTPSHFIHPAEAFHGDLGRFRQGDVALLLSFSGETQDIVQLTQVLRERSVEVILVTGRPESTSAQLATIALDLGPMTEACLHGLAPTTSTTAMLAAGDALALVVSRLRGFEPEDFARFHPGGSLGRQLARVEEVMRPRADCRVIVESCTIQEMLVTTGRKGRRSGAVMVTDQHDRLRGIFTDSDLAKFLEAGHEAPLDASLSEVMTKAPFAVSEGTLLPEAMAVFKAEKISELPVLDELGKPLGLLDVTDLLDATDLVDTAEPPQSTQLLRSPRKAKKRSTHLKIFANPREDDARKQ